jgi:hypothetical protein
MSTAPARAESSRLRNIMIAATVVGVLLLIASGGLLMMSPMLFDSGASAASWSIFIAVWMAPLVLIAGIVIGWIGFACGTPHMVTAGLVIAALPVLAAVGVFVMAGA